MPDINLFINGKDTSGPAFKSAESNINKLTGQAEGASNKISTMGVALGTALGTVVGNGVTTAIGKLGELVGSVVTTGVNFDNMKQQAQIAFSTMLGSGQQAKSFLDNLQAFAAKTPFEFPDLLTASQRMLAMGFQSNQVLPTLTAIGDAVAGLGGNSQMVDRVTTALGQMQAKGKATGEEMMQLTEAGIPAWEFLAKKIGVSIPEAMQMVTKGSVDANTAITALVDGMNAKFGGLMDQQSKTFGGLLSTIKDTFAQISGKVMQPVFDLISRGLQSVVDWTSKPEFTAGVEKLAAWVQEVSDRVAKWIADVWPRAISALESVQAIIKLLVSGDFRGGIFGMNEDDPFINALLAARQAGIWLYDQIRRLVAVFGDWAGRVLPPLLDGLGKFFDWMSKAIEVVKTISRPVVDAIAKFVKFDDVMGALGVLLSGPVLAAFGGILLGLGQFLAPILAVTAAVAALRLAWQNDFFGIRTLTQQVLKNLSDWFYKESGIWKGTFEKTMEYLTWWAQGGWKNNIYFPIRSYLIGLGADINEWKMRSVAYFKEWVDKTVETIQGWYETGKHIFFSFINDTHAKVDWWVGEIKNFFEDYFGETGILATKLLPFKNQMLVTWKNISEGFMEKWQAIIDWWDRNVQPWIDKGIAIVQGLWDGMKQTWHDLSEWFTGVWGDLTDRFKRFFGIASPSTLFRSYGEYMMDGLREGIASRSASVQAEVDSLSNSLTIKMAMLKGAIVKDMSSIINAPAANGMVFLPGVTNLPKGSTTTPVVAGPTGPTIGGAVGGNTTTTGTAQGLLGGISLTTPDIQAAKDSAKAAADKVKDFIAGIGDFLNSTFANQKVWTTLGLTPEQLKAQKDNPNIIQRGSLGLPELRAADESIRRTMESLLGVAALNGDAAANVKGVLDKISAGTDLNKVANLLQSVVDYRTLANYYSNSDFANVLPNDPRLTGNSGQNNTYQYNITLQGSNNANADVMGLIQLLGGLQAGATP